MENPLQHRVIVCRAPCWKFEKLQIMPLGFGHLESSEKSEKIHKYYTYRAIITEIYKAQWQVLMEIQSSHQMPPVMPPSHHVTSASTMAGAMLEI